MSGSQPRPRLRLGAGKAPRRTGVGDRRAAVVDDFPHLGERRDAAGVEVGIEHARRDLGHLRGHRAAFPLPAVEAAVEEQHVLAPITRNIHQTRGAENRPGPS